MTPTHNIVVGVAGGIAAYKVAGLVRGLKEAGHNVTVIPTPAALRFVGTATWEALSGNPVVTGVWDNVAEVPHVRLGQSADLVIVAPATADLLARAAAGIADDLLTNTLLTARCPIVVAPAMHTEMWQHPATVANVATLSARGVHILPPAEGRLTGGDSGPGRLPEPNEIIEFALGQLQPRDLAGLRICISAGGTREYIDPVRFLGNSSSGKQGVALASAALARGAEVTLVAANISSPVPAGINLVSVVSAADVDEAMTAASATNDVLIMAAAVADFRPKTQLENKLKKTDSNSVPELELEQTVDVLAKLVANKRATQIIVGFAAETGDALMSPVEYGRRKLTAKGCDLLVVNAVGHGLAFGTDDNAVTILSSDSEVETQVPLGPKRAIADAILTQVALRCAR